MRPGLLAWQWQGYPTFHRTRVNLLIHIVAVPVFILAFVTFLALLAALRWGPALVAVLTFAAAFGVQGIGHKREPEGPIPFLGALDFVSRTLAEQFVTFPRFVLSGEWGKALARSGEGA